MENKSIASMRIKRASITELLDANDELAVEEPLEINLCYTINGTAECKTISVTMRTPGNDEELALGYLLTEGVIKHSDQILITHVSFAENKARITLKENEEPFLQKTERNFYTTSSCGVCGKTSIAAIRAVSSFKNEESKICLKADLFYHLENELRKQQAVFKCTGGLHASALFDLRGNFIMLREDVGRHNALDKLIGAAFMKDELPLNNKILLLSGRASFELIQKASMAGIKVVAAVGAPSSLAVELAKDAGITLIGFLRSKGFNIYSGENRIIAE